VGYSERSAFVQTRVRDKAHEVLGPPSVQDATNVKTLKRCTKWLLVGTVELIISGYARLTSTQLRDEPESCRQRLGGIREPFWVERANVPL